MRPPSPGWWPRAHIFEMVTLHGTVTGTVWFEARRQLWRWRAQAPSRAFDFGEHGVETSWLQARRAAEHAAKAIAATLTAEDACGGEK